jgi:hypothetical protein
MGSPEASFANGRFGKDEGASPSSLQAVHRQCAPDRHYDLQLLRDLEIINARMRNEFGPLPIGGVPLIRRRKPDLIAQSPSGELLSKDPEEKKAMKLQFLAMAAATTLTSGCVSLVTNSHGHAASKVENGVLKIPFHDHGFDAKCYDTLRCRVAYDNSYVVNDVGPRGSFTERDRANLGSHWSILDFPSVAEVAWTSKDGADHNEKIDLRSIFRSRLIRYPADLDVNDVDLIPYSGTPDIILVVEGRSVHVYMKAWISLLKPRYRDREHSNFRHDPVIAFSKTY